jgi:ribosomal protein L10
MEARMPSRLRAFLLPVAIIFDDDEAHKMIRLLEELQRPHRRDHYELIKGVREGVYWQAKDGLIVRLAAAEAVREAEVVARALLDLAGTKRGNGHRRFAARVAAMPAAR